MRRLILVAAAGLLTIGCAARGGVNTAPRYRVTPVKTTQDAIECAKAGGYAMMAATIDEATGEVNSTWGAGCAILEKD